MATRTAAALSTLDLPVHQAIAEAHDPAAAYAERISALFHLEDAAAISPASCGTETLECLDRMLQDPRLGSRRQDLFLARKAAEVLLTLAHAPHPILSDGAWNALLRTLCRTRGLVHRGAAETVGGLSCLQKVESPTLPPIHRVDRPVPWTTILSRAGMKTPFKVEIQGRSLLVRNGLVGQILVVKQARAAQDPTDLAREAGWMQWLTDATSRFGCRFEVPTPLDFDGVHLVRVAHLPEAKPCQADLHPEGWSICYLAPEIYFVYPNDQRSEHRPGPEDFVEMMARAARLLGTLAGTGIVHEAPIPLFHNRVQRHRRRDAGRYEWFRGGRLDRWLSSCAYPNWGPNGLRDFEHLIEFSGPPLHLYRHLGNHFLSLLLVAGSYFRARENSCLPPAGG